MEQISSVKQSIPNEQDVAALNKFNTNNVHRMVLAKIKIYLDKEMMKKETTNMDAGNLRQSISKLH